MNILIRMPNWIGDAVMATAALKNIQKHFPDGNIYLITSPAAYEMFSYDPSIKKVYIDNSKKFFLRYKRLSVLAEEIKADIQEEIDLGITFQNNFPSALLLKLIGVKKIYGAKNALRNLILSKSIKVDKSLHQVEVYNQIVNGTLETTYETGDTTLFTPPVKKDERKRVGINPGAAYGSAKRWEPHKFAEVALKLSDEYEIIILGTAAESDIANKIESVLAFNSAKKYQNLAGKTSVYELLQIISTLDLFITNDSGPMHIAGAFKIPTVSIFGSTNHIQTNQWKNHNSIIVRTGIDCSPCMKRVCPKEHHKCMRDIHPKTVLKSINDLNLRNNF